MNRKKHHSVIERVEQARLQSQINQNFANELIQSIEEEKKRNNASFLLGIKALLVICFALLIALFLILDRNNALEEDITSNQNLVTLLEQRDSTFTRMLGMDTLLVYRVKNGEPVTYKELDQANDSLSSCLDLILNRYPIHIKHLDSTYQIEATAIDSALLLLPMYRDMIKYDKRNKEWIVTRLHLPKR